MRVRSLIARHFLFLIIFLIALFLRVYRISQLTTFGRDQGIDFAAVKQMIVEKKPTLIGIEVSLATFHQGPVYLYLLVPLFYLMKFNPIAGAYTAVCVASLTLIALYAVTLRFFGRASALWGAAFFAISPEFVREGNTPLYQHFLPLFIVISLYMLLKLFEIKSLQKQLLWALLLGITVGICLEIHFLAITFATAILVLLCIQTHNNARLLLTYILGIEIGVIPTITFELRHEFLNSHLLWSYFTSPRSQHQSQSFLGWIQPWLESQTKWFGADVPLLGVTLLIWTIFAIFFIRPKNAQQKIIHILFVLTAMLSVLCQFGIQDFQAHYLIPSLILELLLLPLCAQQLQLTKRMIAYVVGFAIIFCSFAAVLFGFHSNHGYSMTDGWNLEKIESTAQLIAKDSKNKTHVNLASLLDGDAREYPLRYVLENEGVTLDSTENYSRSSYLYLLSRTDEAGVNSSNLWEIASFQPFVITGHWDLQDGIFLYRLQKK